jgi:hypothetical protein
MVALPPEHNVVLPEIETVGGGITVMTALPVCGWLQPGEPAEVALTSTKVVVVE